ERVAADSGSPIWNIYFKGTDKLRRKFVKMFFMSGGYGARADSDGPACLSFPTNVANSPIEQFEVQTPLIVTEKRLITDSGGAGRFRGGPGQRLSFRSVSDDPLTFLIRHERVEHPPRGLLGGLPGSAGVDMLNGERIAAKSVVTMKAGDIATFETPGGGGMYPPAERCMDAIREDLVNGIVSLDAARRDYGVQAETLSLQADSKETNS